MENRWLEEVRLWMHRNARELELREWACLFENGDPLAVAQALLPYQNADGGFGNALEPDNWNPNSTPYTTLYALRILDMVGFADYAHPVYQGIRRYLNSGAERNEHGWYFCTPSSTQFPCAPWHKYDETGNQTESVGVTASLCAFIFKAMQPQDAAYAYAMERAPMLIRHFTADPAMGEMGLEGYMDLIPVLETQALFDFDYPALKEALRSLVNGTIERDAGKWAQYSPRPSRYIAGPDSPYYADNISVVREEVEYLLATRQANGVWPIQWLWYGLMETYAREFAISENWWKGIKAVEIMNFLRHFSAL